MIAQTDKGTLSKKAHAQLARAIALGDIERRITFEESMEFLTDAVVCSSSDICDSDVIETRFCSRVAAMLELYAPVISDRRKALLTPDYAVTLEEFATTRCGVRLANLGLYLD